MPLASQTLPPAGSILPRIIIPVCTDGEKKRESKKGQSGRTRPGCGHAQWRIGAMSHRLLERTMSVRR